MDNFYLKLKYRKLGGWLMFIFVMGIITAVSSGLSLVSNLSSLPLFSAFSSTTMYGYNSEIIYALFTSGFRNILFFSIASSVLALASNIAKLVFLQKRNAKLFKIFFFLEQALSILASAIVFYFIYRVFAPFFSYISAEINSSRLDVFISSLFTTFICAISITLLIQAGLLITWLFYFKRSKRVAVYFDPDYDGPDPDAYEAEMYAVQAQQAYPYTGYTTTTGNDWQAYYSYYYPQYYSAYYGAPTAPYGPTPGPAPAAPRPGSTPASGQAQSGAPGQTTGGPVPSVESAAAPENAPSAESPAGAGKDEKPEEDTTEKE